MSEQKGVHSSSSLPSVQEKGKGSLFKDSFFKIHSLSKQVIPEKKGIDLTYKQLGQCIDDLQQTYQYRLKKLKQIKETGDLTSDGFDGVNTRAETYEAFEPVLREEDYSRIKWLADRLNSICSYIEPSQVALDLTIDIVRAKIITDAERELTRLQNQLRTLKPTKLEKQEIESLKRQLEAVYIDLKEHQETVNKDFQKSRKHLFKQAANFARYSPIAKLLGMESSVLQKTLKNVITLVFDWKDYQELNEPLTLQKNFENFLQPTVIINDQILKKDKTNLAIPADSPESPKEEFSKKEAKKEADFQRAAEITEAKQKEIETFIESLKACKTTREIQDQLDDLGIDMQAPRRVIQSFIQSLKNCQTIEEANSILEKAKSDSAISPILLNKLSRLVQKDSDIQVIQKKFVELAVKEAPIYLKDWQAKFKNPKVISLIRQQYCCKKGWTISITGNDVVHKLKAREQLFNQLVEQTRTTIQQFLQEKKELDYETVRQDFKERFNLSLSLKDWVLLKGHYPEEMSGVYTELAKELVRRTETNKAMIDKATVTANLTKMEIEKGSLQFLKIKQIIDMSFGAIETVLNLPLMGKKIAFASQWTLVKYLAIDLTDYAIFNLLYFIFIDLETVLIHLIRQLSLALVGYVFIREKKPSAYSFKAYQIDARYQLLNLQEKGENLVFTLQRLFLEARIKLNQFIQSRVSLASQEKWNGIELKKQQAALLEQQIHKTRDYQKVKAVLEQDLINFNLADFNAAMGVQFGVAEEIGKSLDELNKDLKLIQKQDTQKADATLEEWTEETNNRLKESFRLSYLNDSTSTTERLQAIFSSDAKSLANWYAESRSVSILTTR